jgi:aspartate carbamoyltransferase regulatory subunit
MAESIYISDEIKNKYDNSPFRIPLRNNKGVIVEYALVDEDDFEKVNKYKWCLSSGYAVGTVDKKSILLHHFVFKKPENGNVIDHINQDKLNNDKLNLREVSRSMNGHNVKKNTNIELSSKYKGVSWSKNEKKWRSVCTLEKKKEFLGVFETEEEAAKAYDIFTFKKIENPNNNNLVKYEDTLEINIDDIVRKPSNIYDTPKNIYFNKTQNKFRAHKYYKKNYIGINRETVDEAIKDLEEINKIIELLKQAENKEHNKKDITRNNDGIPYIKVKDLEVLVDENNWHELSNISWSISSDGYIFNSKEGKMHRYIMKAKNGEIIDHINNKRYDNRNCNLRIASSGLNNHNSTKSKNSSSKYFGVCFNKKDKKWMSRITYNGKTHYIGSFKDEIGAAKAYNAKAIFYYKENANLNVFI